MKTHRNGCLWTFLDYSFSLIACIPFCVGLPSVFWNLWFEATRASGNGGGMFYFPSTPSEFVWFSAFNISVLPFFIANIAFTFPVHYTLNWLGIDASKYGYKLPLAGGYLTIEGSTFIAMLPALIVQILFWGMLFHSIRLASRVCWRAVHSLLRRRQTQV